MPAVTLTPDEARTLAAAPAPVVLWRVEYCASDIGLCGSAWFATDAEARAYVAELVRVQGFRRVAEMYGEYATVRRPERVTVDPTPAGLLEFAGLYASGDAS